MAAKKKPAAKKTARAQPVKTATRAKTATAKAKTAKAKTTTKAKPRAKRAAATKKPAGQRSAVPALTTQQLLAVFSALGAKDPSQWVAHHQQSGGDELTAFALLRALWMRAVEPGRLLAKAQNHPHVKDAFERALLWMNIADIDALVRLAQEQTLLDVLGVLDDPSGGDGDSAVNWGVFRVDENGQPLWSLADLKTRLEAARP